MIVGGVQKCSGNDDDDDDDDALLIVDAKILIK